MKSILGFVGTLVVVGSFGCGTTVNVLGGEDGTGGAGEGGAGGNGEGAQGPGPVGPGPGPGPSTSTGPNPPPPNPEGCPTSSPDYYGECQISNLACAYLEEQGCTVSYTCVTTEDCYEGSTGTGGYDGGYGGYGDCYEYSYWQPTTASCVPSSTDCSVAQSGDVCALPGEYCSGSPDDYCTYEDKWCGEDHRWVVETWEDECCYDDCCYDDCYCEPYYCPEYAPENGEYCDPCYDSDYCGYEVPDPNCGYVYASAYCNPDTYSWEVYTEGCTGTTSVSVGPSAVSTGSGQGGWEGTGGFDGGGGHF